MHPSLGFRKGPFRVTFQRLFIYLFIISIIHINCCLAHCCNFPRTFSFSTNRWKNFITSGGLFLGDMIDPGSDFYHQMKC